MYTIDYNASFVNNLSCGFKYDVYPPVISISDLSVLVEKTINTELGIPSETYPIQFVVFMRKIGQNYSK